MRFYPVRLGQWLLSVLVLVAVFNVARSASASENDYTFIFRDSAYLDLPVRLDTFENLTVEVWLQPTVANQDCYPLSFGQDSSLVGLHLYGDLLPGFESPIGLSGSQIESITGNVSRLHLGKWVHIAFTKSGSLWTLYRNGMRVGRGHYLLGAIQSMHIGQGFQGKIGSIRIWSAILTSEELRQHLFNPRSVDSRLRYNISARIGGNDNQIDSITHQLLELRSLQQESLTEQSDLSLQGSTAPRIALTQFPSHLQFIPRQASGYGEIHVSGFSVDSDCDSIILERYRNDLEDKRFAYSMRSSESGNSFAIEDSIFAENALYSYRLSALRNDSLYYIAEGWDIVAGDVFLIDGQSNAHFAIDWYYWQSPFWRSFGIQTENLNYDSYDPADTCWGFANCSGWGGYLTGAYSVGVWGLRLQKDISEKYNLPVCIINGAAGASTIAEHERSESNHSDLSTVYGRLLYRTDRSELSESVRAIFWDQGEFDSAKNYSDKFKALRSSWLTDYSTSHKIAIYLLQVRPGCGPDDGSALREVERVLPDSFPNISIMSTVGVQGHDGCHYDAYGYDDIGDALARQVERDLYHSTDTFDIDPPNVQSACYGNRDSSTITILFRSPTELKKDSDLTAGGSIEKLSDYFFLDGQSGSVNEVHIQSDTIILLLKHSAHALSLSYLPDKNYLDQAAVYEGPWIKNSRGIGMLSFNNLQIGPYIPTLPNAVEPLNSKDDILLSVQNAPLECRLTLQQPRFISFQIVDVAGNIVAQRAGSFFAPGVTSLRWNEMELLPPGVYFLRASTNEVAVTTRYIRD